MATSKEDMQDEKLSFRRFEEGDYVTTDFSKQIFKEDTSHKCPTYVHRTPPCQGSCPSGEDIRGWLDIVRGIELPPEGTSMQEYAFQRSTDANPFPSMMGRVCPAPCQDGCNRNNVEDFVGINSVEQYIGDTATSENFQFDNSAAMTGKKVAIIGGGPAGLAAAYQLRRMGHASTVFDDHSELGGMFKYGIPGYRTPREFLNAEIDRIVDMNGIEVKLNTRVGKDVAVADLEKDYDAVLWAIGCKSGRALPVPNADAPNCVSGVAFLEAFNKGDMQVTANKVVCEHEVEDATIEGVDIQTGVMPIEVIVDGDGRATALRMAKCNLVDGRPEAIEGTEYEIEADLIVSAIGQGGDLEGIEDLDNGRGLIDADAFYRVPGKEGHFVCGDIVRPHLLTTAIGQASIVAETIDAYFNESKLRKRPKVDVHHFNLQQKLTEAGLGVEDYDSNEHLDDASRGTEHQKYAVHNYEDRAANEIISADQLFLGHFEYTERHLRKINVPTSEEVLGHFAERQVGLTEEEAVAEADRCMSCGMCFECDNCVIYCPQDAIFRVKKDEKTMGRYVDTDYTKCIGCHICADVCPTGYIDMALGDG